MSQQSASEQWICNAERQKYYYYDQRNDEFVFEDGQRAPRPSHIPRTSFPNAASTTTASAASYVQVPVGQSPNYSPESTQQATPTLIRPRPGGQSQLGRLRTSDAVRDEEDPDKHRQGSHDDRRPRPKHPDDDTDEDDGRYAQRQRSDPRTMPVAVRSIGPDRLPPQRIDPATSAIAPSAKRAVSKNPSRPDDTRVMARPPLDTTIPARPGESGSSQYRVADSAPLPPRHNPTGTSGHSFAAGNLDKRILSSHDNRDRRKPGFSGPSNRDEREMTIDRVAGKSDAQRRPETAARHLNEAQNAPFAGMTRVGFSREQAIEGSRRQTIDRQPHQNSDSDELSESDTSEPAALTQNARSRGPSTQQRTTSKAEKHRGSASDSVARGSKSAAPTKPAKSGGNTSSQQKHKSKESQNAIMRTDSVTGPGDTNVVAARASARQHSETSARPQHPTKQATSAIENADRVPVEQVTGHVRALREYAEEHDLMWQVRITQAGLESMANNREARDSALKRIRDNLNAQMKAKNDKEDSSDDD